MPEDDQDLVETCSHGVYINKEPINICVDGNCVVIYQIESCMDEVNLRRNVRQHQCVLH